MTVFNFVCKLYIHHRW